MKLSLNSSFKMNDLMLRKGVDIKSHLITNVNTMGELNNQIDNIDYSKS